MYGEGSTTYGVPEIILAYKVSPDQNFKLTSCIFWGDVAAEFLVYKNDDIVAGARTSEAQRTTQTSYIDDSIIFSAGDWLTITAEHYNTGIRDFRCNVSMIRI